MQVFLQERFPWFAGLNIIFDNLDQYNQFVTVRLDHVVLANCTYQSHGLDVEISDSHLSNYQLRFDGSKQDDETSKKHSLVLVNTDLSLIRKKPSSSFIWSSIGISHGIAYFLNVTISDMIQTFPVIMLTNQSSLTLDTCNISNIEAIEWWIFPDAFIVSVQNSNLLITGSQINNNFCWQRGVLGVGQNSTVTTTNSTFSSNLVSTCVMCVNNSVILISESVFWNNTGGVIFASPNARVGVANSMFDSNWFSVIYATMAADISINQTSFLNNSAPSGGAIYATTNVKVFLHDVMFMNNSVNKSRGGAIAISNNCELHVISSNFSNNKADWMGGVLSVLSENVLMIKDTLFASNFAMVEDGVLYAEGTGDILFDNCTFFNNSAALSRGIGSANGKINMTINRCTFENNTAALTGIILVQGGANLQVRNSIFMRNSGLQRCLLYIDFGVKLTVDSTLFSNNTGSKLIWTTSDADLCLTNCTFSNNALNPGSLIIVSRSKLIVTECNFKNNVQISNGGIIVGRYESKVFIKSTHFVGNSASVGGVFHLTTGATLWLESSTLIDNHSSNGGVAYVQDSSIVIDNCTFANCSSIGNGGVISAVNATTLHIKNCSFMSNNAVYGGCLHAERDTSLEVHNSIFYHNFARQGGVLDKSGSGNVTLQNTILKKNYHGSGEAIFIANTDTFRLAQGLCFQESSTSTPCILFNCMSLSPQQCHLETYNYTFTSDATSINSKKNKDFFFEAQGDFFIQRAGHMENPWNESPYASCKHTHCHCLV